MDVPQVHKKENIQLSWHKDGFNLSQGSLTWGPDVYSNYTTSKNTATYNKCIRHLWVQEVDKYCSCRNAF